MHFLLPPVIGAFIGYITNYLAVKMLFRPFEEKRIFGLKVPFTPGLIPKRRKEIAVSIAKVIEEHLLTPEKLHSLFEETGYRERLKGRIEDVFDKLVEQIVYSIKENIKEGISIGKFSIKTAVFATAVEKVVEKASDRIKEKLKEKLLEKASDSIEKNIEEELPQILSELNVEKLVVETFLEMDIQTLERVVLGFSEKQLKHITYTGAVLGFLIGLLQDITLFLNL
ncbi:DUF445 family protein [Persephonella atlantica]|uniref:DUF445 family protein n=1 Tax=Persephonella atlantica TaxID=2699429 RepID=A0ABS1GFG9_9AQUI|nr:DUF445 family protein [Persephonella atlantica]